MSNTPNPINAPALIWSISLLELWKCTTAIMMIAVKHNTISQHRMQSQKIFLLRNDLSLVEFLLFGGWSRPWLGGPSWRPVRVECSLFIPFLKFQLVVSNVKTPTKQGNGCFRLQWSFAIIKVETVSANCFEIDRTTSHNWFYIDPLKLPHKTSFLWEQFRTTSGDVSGNWNSFILQFALKFSSL